MGFVSTFGRVVQPPFVTAGAAAAVLPWWLSGGAAMPDLVADAALAASYAASLVNLVPGLDVAEINAPGWAAGTGWIFDGIADVLNTQIVPDATTCYLVQFDNYVASGWNALFGSADTVNDSHAIVYPGVAGQHLAFWGAGWFFATDVPEVGDGVLGNQGGVQGWYNGAGFGVHVNAWVLSVRPMYIGCRNMDGVADSFIAAHIQRLVVWKTNPPAAAQLAAVSVAMAAL